MLPREDQSVYSIGIVAEIIGVHPETLRIWERNGIVCPARRNQRRLYSPLDLKRLKFARGLIEKDRLNLAGVSKVVQMYPCWQRKYCSGGKPQSFKEQVNPLKPCWKEPGTYCLRTEDKADFCSGCRFQKGRKEHAESKHSNCGEGI